MKRFMRVGILTALATTILCADVSYRETINLKSGMLVDMLQKMASNPALGKAGDSLKQVLEGQTYDVYLKGNQMARIGSHSSYIYDMDGGTMTLINHDRQTYSVQTFDEMSQQFQHMQQKMGKAIGDLQFDAKVSKTGQTQQIGGETATETVITLTAKQSSEQGQMAATVHSWLVPMNPVRQQVRDFQKRLGEKVSSAMLTGVSPMLSFAGSGLSAALKEMSKIDGGYPVLSIATVTGSLGAGNPLAALAAMSGGAATDPNAPLIVTESRYDNFVEGAANESKFTVPAGYKPEKAPQFSAH